jgi:hypothetical protein
MKPLDVLTALDAAGDKATQGEWCQSDPEFGDHDKSHFVCAGDPDDPSANLILTVEPSSAPDSDMADARFVVDSANARPALKQHLAAVARLVEAARRLLNGGDCTCDPAPQGGRIDVCATCEIRAALKEVERDAG